MSVAVLSPHLDDAVLSAWATLRRGGDVLVVNVFDGVPPPGTLGGWDRATGASDSSARMRERLEEDRAALAIAGVPAASLGLLEHDYRGEPPAPGALGDALAGAVAGRAEVWAPAGIGGHPDHVAVRDWALAAGLDGAAVHLYADLPYAVSHGWPARVDGAEPEAHVLAADEAERKLSALAEYRSQIDALDAGAAGLLRDPAAVRYEVSWAVGR